MQAHRTEELRDLLDEHLHAGESFNVRWSGTEMEIHPVAAGGAGSPSTLVQSEPQLYGLLLRLNEQIGDAGGWLVIWTMLGAVGVCVGVAFGWFDNAFGDLEALRRWWVYPLFLFVTLMVLGKFVNAREHRVRGHHEDELEHALAIAGLSRDALITAIREDEDLTSLFQVLKERGD